MSQSSPIFRNNSISRRVGLIWIAFITAIVVNQVWISSADWIIGTSSPYGSARISETRRNAKPSADISTALKCLGHGYASDTTQSNRSNITIQYPEDPFAHFQEIHDKLSRWNLTYIPPHRAAGYKGPWLEDHWQQHFHSRAQYLTNENFSSVFGPYIPLLPAWTDIWRAGGSKYSDINLLKTLKVVLRTDVVYITVSQSADGFPGNQKEYQQLQDEYNIVVLSAGGYGHVPVPLLKQPEQLLPKIPVSNRTHLMSYVGRKTHAPKDLRNEMLKILGDDHYYYGGDWRSVMLNSKFSLCPRGFGRTSYHVMETLQMGLIPIHVYSDDDIPWMPYSTTVLRNLSFSTNLENLPTLINELGQLSDARIEQMEQEIERHIDGYFSFEGIMRQIEHFMVSPWQSALTCQPLPKHAGTNRRRPK
jgi:hypothetical protein